MAHTDLRDRIGTTTHVTIYDSAINAMEETNGTPRLTSQYALQEFLKIFDAENRLKVDLRTAWFDEDPAAKIMWARLREIVPALRGFSKGQAIVDKDLKEACATFLRCWKAMVFSETRPA